MKPEPLAVSDNPEATVVLSPLLERDIEAIAHWYDKATVLAGSPVPLRDALSCGGRRQAFALTLGQDPDPVGLALYFWLRLGYRPVVSSRGLWMISDLSA